MPRGGTPSLMMTMVRVPGRLIPLRCPGCGLGHWVHKARWTQLTLVFHPRTKSHAHSRLIAMETISRKTIAARHQPLFQVSHCTQYGKWQGNLEVFIVFSWLSFFLSK